MSKLGSNSHRVSINLLQTNQGTNACPLKSFRFNFDNFLTCSCPIGQYSDGL